MTKKKAFGYCRLSEEEEAKGINESESITNQKKLIQQFCASQDDISIVRFYEDIKSGAKDRKDFTKMFEDAKIEKPDFVIVKDWSRFARGYSKSEATEKQFKDVGVEIISIYDRNLDERGKRFKWFIDEFYVIDGRLKTEAIHGMKLKEGIPLNRPPFGYKVDKKHKRFVPDKNADKVKEIYSLAESGLKVKEIALNMGMPPFKVLRILHNPTYLGKFVYRGNLYDGKHEPLVNEEVFNRLNNKK